MNIPIYSSIDLKNNKIINCGLPENDTDVVTRLFLNTQLANSEKKFTDQLSNQKLEIYESINQLSDTLNETINTNIANVNQTIDNSIKDSIVDSVTITAKDKSLSANQGSILNNNLNNLQDIVENLPLNIFSTTSKLVGLWETTPIYRYIHTEAITDTTTEQINIDLSKLFTTTSGDILNINGQYVDIDNIKHWFSYTPNIGIEYNTVTHILNINIPSSLLGKLLNKDLKIMVEYTLNESEVK